jgi:surface polysaccharide O-acyltransferase-like enzyme
MNKNFINMPGNGAIILLGYSSPITVMSALALFCIIRQKNTSSRIFDIISPICFGMYLIHMLFINFLYKVIKFSPEKYPLVIVIICVSTITMISSIVFTYMARRIKFIRKYVL